MRCDNCGGPVKTGLVSGGVAWHYGCRDTDVVVRVTLSIDERTHDVLTRLGRGNASLGARIVCKSLEDSDIDLLAEGA